MIVPMLCVGAISQRHKKGDLIGSPFCRAQELLTAVNLIKDSTIIEVGLLHCPPVTKGLFH